jgi:ABC-type transport system substrate-binding protein
MTRRPRVHALKGLSLCVVLAIGAAACGSDDDKTTTDATTLSDADSTTPGSDTAVDGTDPATDGTEPPSDSTDPVAGGDLTYGTILEPAGMDPTTVDFSPAVGGNPGLAVYDSLMRVTGEDEIVPYLALSLESDDAKTWTMKLRPGVEFTDGTPFDADAVVFNIERHLDPTKGAASKAATYAALIDTVKALDPETVEFVLKDQFAAFGYGLTQTLGYIGSPTAIQTDEAGFNTNPVGAGPFMMKEWLKDDHMTLVKNPDYWQDGLPYLDSITYKPITDSATRLNALTSGQVQLAYSQTIDDLKQAQDTGNLNVDIDATGNGGSALQINVSKAPMDDIRIRQAIAHALDFDALNQTVFGGASERRTGPFSPDSSWYLDQPDFPSYDPEKAKALVDEYEAETGTQATIVWQSTTSQAGAQGVQASEVFQQLLGDVGIDVTIEQYDGAEWFQNLLDGNFDVDASTYPHFSDPSEIAKMLSSTSPLNFKHYSNPAMDAALAKGGTSTDPDERKAAYQEAQRILSEDLPMIWFASGSVGIMSTKEVGGIDKTRDATLYPATLTLSSQ